jgi:hypothetical protein
MTEAVVQLTKGLEVLTDLPEGAARQRCELDLQLTLSLALTATHGWGKPVVGETYARAHEFCEQLDQRQHLGSVLFGQHVHHLVRGEHEQSLERGEALLRLGEIRNDPAVTVDTLFLHAIASSAASCSTSIWQRWWRNAARTAL